jgi:hypothetical protein
MKAIPERSFERIMKAAGCTWTTTDSDDNAIWYQGKLVSTYSIWHAKGRKREISLAYVDRFNKLIAAIAADLAGK